ncbi:hypothetical protein NA57DRAFT_66492 [Rhizodiscina lignyota]|uniref:Uncharacterized protein n=1 Tax=Rhizodiscina lignyota TaxID=1504668 RepID=A0A9P4IEW8_9PEZI|nr:hypothetical protein NA57DRAFT_66492 [Rhizodiscina lignyota]
MAEPGPVAEAFGQIAYAFSEVQPLIPTYAHLLLSALFPIYAGAHASLSRPSSAAKSGIYKRRSYATEDEDEDEEDKVQRMEGLSPSDALMFPVLAGCTLAGLYFLIKWLQDPALLNKILNWYFAVFGAVSVARLVADALAWINGMLFPNIWVQRDGVAWEVDNLSRRVVADVKGKQRITWAPLPGILSKLPLPDSVTNVLWTLREIPKHKWTIQVYARHVISARTHIGIHGFIGTIVAGVAVMYFNLVDKPWWLTNLMGFGFSYGALQLMSPTTFGTGALILSALFFYDIYFVFYTPMMVTVAKSLDIPIKLLFPRPPEPGVPPEQAKRTHAMLGLGDVVLPGIMIGLALRFDLYMFYLKKQRKLQKPATIDEQGRVGYDTVVIKDPYTTLSGKWGDAFWSHSWTGRFLIPVIDTSSPLSKYDETTFPKPYFHASVAGYLLGLLTTLGVMHVFHHAQPALLYLVPGVLLSLLLAGAVRGELKEMWEFTEAEEEEVEEKKEKEKSKSDEKDSNKSKEDAAKKTTNEQDKKKEDIKEIEVEEEEKGEDKEVSAEGTSRRNWELKDSSKDDDGEPPHKIRRMS